MVHDLDSLQRNYWEKSKMLARKTLLVSLCAAVLLSGLIISGFTLAHQGATGVVKERMELMKALGDHMKSMAAMVKGKVPFDAGQMAAGAQAIQDKAPKMVHLFPEGSLRKPSEALPSIWQQWDKFSELAERLTSEAGGLSDIAVAGSRREIMVQFTRVGKTCSGCHTDFRKEQKK